MADAAVQERRGKTQVRFKCPGCGKTHGDPSEVFKCEAKALIAKGYIQISKRQFQAPDGYILVLNRRPARAYAGKAGRYQKHKYSQVSHASNLSPIISW